MGYGAREVVDDVLALAEIMGAPVATTFKGKALIPDSHPNAAGVLGRSGTPIASWFMNECDLILALGSSFANHTGIEPSKKIIQVDYDRMQLGKFHPGRAPDLGRDRSLLARGLSPHHRPCAHGTRSKNSSSAGPSGGRKRRAGGMTTWGKGIPAALIFEVLGDVCPDDAIIAVDVGNNTYSFGRYFESGGQSVLMSGYLGSIGFGFPAAMGAWAATRDFDHLKGRKVISISGDGGFGQYAMEFTTAVKYGMEITHILLNNGQLGKITKEQRAGKFEGLADRPRQSLLRHPGAPVRRPWRARDGSCQTSRRNPARA